jgi:B12-binding domain/radical SAM domain protein
MDEVESRLRPALEVFRPNLLLIGSMSICLPGAVACARLAKDLLGEEVCVVLGGRHASESVFRGPSGEVVHHPSSPLRLMAEGAVPQVFDIVTSGDGEHLVVALGELVARQVKLHRKPAKARDELRRLANVPGCWIVGRQHGAQVETIVGRGPELNPDSLPPPCALFGVQARFNVFGGRPTAHVFSDVGSGCIYDCTFCSERGSVTGRLRALETSADRLFEQVAAAVRVIADDYPGQGASAFCEDSTFLAFTPRLIERFVDRMSRAGLEVRLGGQLTIDQTLRASHLLPGLRSVGLEYLFVGVETFSPAEVGGMSKDVGERHGAWIARAESAFETLDAAGIVGGAAILFGLGESQVSRLSLLEQLRTWRASTGMPYPVSLNWAVQHPLLGRDGGTGYQYMDWAIPEGPFLEAFRDYGEASIRYPLAGVPQPTLADLLELRAAAADLLRPPTSRSGHLSQPWKNPLSQRGVTSVVSQS